MSMDKDTTDLVDSKVEKKETETSLAEHAAITAEWEKSFNEICKPLHFTI